jgi:hypothetical protein
LNLNTLVQRLIAKCLLDENPAIVHQKIAPLSCNGVFDNIIASLEEFKQTIGAFAVPNQSADGRLDATIVSRAMVFRKVWVSERRCGRHESLIVARRRLKAYERRKGNFEIKWRSLRERWFDPPLSLSFVFVRRLKKP